MNTPESSFSVKPEENQETRVGRVVPPSDRDIVNLYLHHQPLPPTQIIFEVSEEESENIDETDTP